MSMDWDKILADVDEEGGSGDFEVLPKNKYPVIVDECEATTASTGAKMLKLTLKVEGGPYNDRLLWTNIVFSVNNPKAMGFTLRKLSALGISREFIASNNPSLEQLAKMLPGQRAIADVTVKPYEGADTNDVKGFRSVEGNAAMPSMPKPAGVPDIPIPPSSSVGEGDSGGDPF